MVLQADRTIRIPLFANSRRQPEVCSDIRCVDRRHANAALIQISEKLPGMPTPNANVLTFPPLPDKMRLKPLKVRIAGRWRRPLTLARPAEDDESPLCECTAIPPAGEVIGYIVSDNSSGADQGTNRGPAGTRVQAGIC